MREMDRDPFWLKIANTCDLAPKLHTHYIYPFSWHELESFNGPSPIYCRCGVADGFKSSRVETQKNWETLAGEMPNCSREAEATGLRERRRVPLSLRGNGPVVGLATLVLFDNLSRVCACVGDGPSTGSRLQGGTPRAEVRGTEERAATAPALPSPAARLRAEAAPASPSSPASQASGWTEPQREPRLSPGSLNP